MRACVGGVGVAWSSSSVSSCWLCVRVKECERVGVKGGEKK